MSAVLRWLQRIAESRMTPDDRMRQQAFRREIDEFWMPADPRERALQHRSDLVHLATSLSAGGLSLFSAGLAGLVVTCGTLVLAIGPAPDRQEYETSVPIWLGAGLALAILSLSIENLRFPREIRPEFGIRIALPLAIATLGSAATMQVWLVWDALLAASLVIAGGGCLASTWGAARRSPQCLGRGVAGIGVGALGVAVSDARWTAIYLDGGYTTYAIGCFMSASGSVLIANGLIFGRPTPRR